MSGPMTKKEKRARRARKKIRRILLLVAVLVGILLVTRTATSGGRMQRYLFPRSACSLFFLGDKRLWTLSSNRLQV